jgi:hypothetical protein
MAFAFNKPASETTATAQADWKATAFLNIWVRRADGSRAKIGAIPLKDQRNFDKALIQRLQQEDGIEALVKALELDFQMADKPASEVNVGF